MSNEKMVSITFGNCQEVVVPQEAIDDICRPGANDEAVAFWEQRVPLDGISIEDMRDEVKESGLDVEDDPERWADETEVRRYFLWLIAWGFYEDRESLAAEEQDDDDEPEEDERYNGWSCWSTWNVALWILNTEERYRVFQAMTKAGASMPEVVAAIFPTGETPDGAKVADADMEELRGLQDDEQ